MHRIRELRKAQNLSQQELAEKMGVDRSTIAKWESGVHAPRTDKLLLLTQVFKCSFEEIFPHHIP